MCRQGAAANPDSEEQQQKLREAAEGLRMATNAAAQNAIKKRLVNKLEVRTEPAKTSKTWRCDEIFLWGHTLFWKPLPVLRWILVIANYNISLLPYLGKVIWCFTAHEVKFCQRLQWKRLIKFSQTAVCIAQRCSFKSDLLQPVKVKNYGIRQQVSQTPQTCLSVL